MVAVGVGIHLLEDGGHISKDGGIKESWRRGTETKAGTNLDDDSFSLQKAFSDFFFSL